ncbi:MAG: Rrf2 family transcriptional regulator [Clostridiales bacterium]|jgi:Rrf2 family protein|nr:Rrf2 family transcriptional regulator [Clostridiales bacterium]
MRISAKGRYALAAITEIARQAREGDNVSVYNISKTLGISKIYLEQVLVQLKKGGVIISIKGSKGGHQLAREPKKITAWDVLLTVENGLVEQAESTVADQAPGIDVMLRSLVFDVLDDAIKRCLDGITVQDMLDCSEQQIFDQAYMLNL